MAISASAVWEVQTGGDDTLNAGYFNAAGSSAGTDFSITAPITCTDLAIDITTNTKVTSATIGFTSAHVRNGLRITAGTGFTTGLYEIVSVSGGAATLDRSPGAVALTGGTASVGGPLASPGGVMALKGVSAGGTGYIKNDGAAGSPTVFTLTGTANTAGGPLSNNNAVNEEWIGYATNRTTLNTDEAPILRCGSNSQTMFNWNSGVARLHNLTFDNPNAKTTAVAVYNNSSSGMWLTRIKISAMTSYGFRCNCTTFALDVNIDTQSGTAAFGCDGGNLVFDRCSAVGGTVGGWIISATVYMKDCIAARMSAQGILVNAATTAYLYHCSASGTTGGNGVGISTSSKTKTIGCVSFGNAQHDFLSGNSTDPDQFLIDCFGGDNSGYPASQVGNFTTLTANPFTAPSGDDYSLNNQPGGGQLVRGLSHLYAGLVTTSYRAGGAVQPAGVGTQVASDAKLRFRLGD